MAEEKKEKKSNPLFDLINALFTNKDYVNNITGSFAKQNLFMVLRRIAIQYPEQANLFNDNKVNALDTIKFWSDYLYCGYTPKWIYTSSKSKSDKKVLSNEDIRTYKKHYCINDKDFHDAMRFYPEETIKDVKEICAFYKKVNSNRLHNEDETDNE